MAILRLVLIGVMSVFACFMSISLAVFSMRTVFRPQDRIVLSLMLVLGLAAVIASIRVQWRLWRRGRPAVALSRHIPTGAIAVHETTHLEPIIAYKVAGIRASQRPFVPLTSPIHYQAIADAKCRHQTGPLPHEPVAMSHRCGFYAHARPESAEVFLNSARGHAQLEVALYGLILEGTNDIYRAQHQRVRRVRFKRLCSDCAPLWPRQAIGFAMNANRSIRPICRDHLAGRNLLELADVSAIVSTQVEWRVSPSDYFVPRAWFDWDLLQALRR